MQLPSEIPKEVQEGLPTDRYYLRWAELPARVGHEQAQAHPENDKENHDLRTREGETEKGKKRENKC